MNTISYIKIKVVEPFSGGWLRVCDGDKQILPSIYLQHLRPPEYQGTSRESARYLRAHRKRDSYELLLSSEDLPTVTFENLTWQLEGKPKKNVTIDIGTRG